MAGSKYQVIVQAQIQENSIQTQLNSLSGKYTFNLKAKIDFTDIEKQIQAFTSKLDELQKQAEQAASGSKGKKGLVAGIDFSQAAESMKQLDNEVLQIKEHFNQLGNNVSVNKIFDEDGIKRYIVSYENVVNGVKEGSSLFGALKTPNEFCLTFLTLKTR